MRPPSLHSGVSVFVFRSAPSEDWWRWRESNPRPEIWL